MPTIIRRYHSLFSMKTTSPILFFKEVIFKCFVKWLSSIVFAFALTCHPALPLTATIYEYNTLKILLNFTKSSELQESKFNTEKKNSKTLWTWLIDVYVTKILITCRLQSFPTSSLI